MKKSKFVFIIMAVIYFAVAIADGFGWLTITNNILLGLSLSALFSSISDIFANFVWKNALANEFAFMTQITSDFLSEKITQNVYSSIINIRNVKLGVENMSNKCQTAVHPSDYHKLKRNTVINTISMGCFILSIAAFILFPFFPPINLPTISMILTLMAFAAMCFNLYMGETISELVEEKNSFMNNTHVLIQIAYPDFSDSFNLQMNYHEDYVAMTNTQEDKPDAHT